MTALGTFENVGGYNYGFAASGILAALPLAPAKCRNTDQECNFNVYFEFDEDQDQYALKINDSKQCDSFYEEGEANQDYAYYVNNHVTFCCFDDINLDRATAASECWDWAYCFCDPPDPPAAAATPVEFQVRGTVGIVKGTHR